MIKLEQHPAAGTTRALDLPIKLLEFGFCALEVEAMVASGAAVAD